MARGGALGSSVLGVTLVVQTSASIHQGQCVYAEAVEAHLQLSVRIGSGLVEKGEPVPARADQR